VKLYADSGFLFSYYSSDANSVRADPFGQLARLAESLALRHTSKLGSRSLDLFHVAIAKALGSDSFGTFDRRQANLASQSGLDLATP